MKSVKAIPDGYHTITPYLIVHNAAEAIDFYKKAFGAVEHLRMPKPDGRIGHAELLIGTSPLMLADEYPEMDILSPKTIGKTGVIMHLYVEDVDSVVDRAVAAGGALLMPVKDQFYGDRSGSLVDPYGHMWNVSTHKEDLTREEIQERMEKMGGECC